MNFPNPPQPQYAPQPQQGYPPQPQYTPQPQYAPQVQQGYYPPQPPQAPPQQPLARGTLSGFFGQPSGSGGPALKFTMVGQQVVGTVARDVTDADVRQQTAFQTNAPLTYRDGTPKLVMIVPIKLDQPTAEAPEGDATWWVKGLDRDELLRAMVAAGVQADEDGVYWAKGGDRIAITYTHDKPGRAGMSPSKMKQVQYQVAAPQAAPAQQVAQQAFNQVVQPQAPVQQFPPTPNPPAPVQQAPLAQPQQYAQQALVVPLADAGSPTPAVPVGLTPAQAAMVAQLGAQQVQPPQG